MNSFTISHVVTRIFLRMHLCSCPCSKVKLNVNKGGRKKERKTEIQTYSTGVNTSNKPFTWLPLEQSRKLIATWTKLIDHSQPQRRKRERKQKRKRFWDNLPSESALRLPTNSHSNIKTFTKIAGINLTGCLALKPSGGFTRFEAATSPCIALASKILSK